jgi:hypothetical protein
MRYLCFVVLLGVCVGQPAAPPLIPIPKFTPPTPVKPVAPPAPANAAPATAQPPATGDELKFLRFLLINVASLDHSPDAVKAYEESLVMQFGLSTQESATIHSVGQTLNTALAELRQSTQTLVAGKTALEPSDVSALASLNAQREQQIATLANQILNSVSATTAARLRSPGHILATGASAAK